MRSRNTLADRPTPDPGDGECLIEVRASGVNPSDVKALLEQSVSGAATGFDWGSACEDGEGSFAQAIAEGATVEVGTVPAHRGKRYAEAVTWAVVREGFRRGATFSNLQAAPMGTSVYARMGFETLTEYRIYVGSV